MPYLNNVWHASAWAADVDESPLACTIQDEPMIRAVRSRMKSNRLFAHKPALLPIDEAGSGAPDPGQQNGRRASRPTQSRRLSAWRKE